MKRAIPFRLLVAGISIALSSGSLWAATQSLSASASGMPDFMPHGYCYLWDPSILWLHVLSDSLIALAYYCIPIVLIYFIRKQHNFPFTRIIWMFGAFILACGTTHLMEVWNVWHGNYLMAGVIKATTAAVSTITVGMLLPLIPKVIALPGRMHLQEENRKLEEQIAQRKRFDAPIDAILRRRVTIGFIGAVLLTIFIGISSWSGARRAEQDTYWVSHTHEEMEAIQRINRHLIEAVTSALTFALTGQEPLLVHYQTARDNVHKDRDALRRLMIENLSQQRRLDVLEPQISVALDFAESIIAKRRKTQAPPGANSALEVENLVDAERGTAKTMFDEETALLGERTKRAQTGQHITRFIAIAGALLGIGLWVLARLAVNREISISSQAQTEINTLNAELEERVEQRTAALHAEIAEREKAEVAREQVLRELADQKFALDQHAIVATTDVQGTITYVNHKFCTISKYAKDELIGQNHRILNSRHHPREFFQEMYHAIANGQVWRGEICNRAKDGSLYWVDTTIVPLLDAEGKPRQYLAIRADITERKQTEEVREHLAAVVDSSDDAIIGKDLNGMINAWNRGAAKILGYEVSAILGKPMLMLLPPERVNEEIGILTRIRQGESIEHFETALIRKDGGKIDVSVTISPIRDSNGAVVGASTIARDITERKHASEALRESEFRFQAMANGIPQLAWMAEADGHIFWYNQRWYEYTGTTFEQMEGWAWQSVHDPDFLPEVMERWQDAIAKAELFDMEFPLRGADGRFRTFLTRIVPVKDSKGRVIRWFGTNTDISERKEAEERLESQADELSRQATELTLSQQAFQNQTILLQSVLDSMAEGLVAADETGKFILWNAAAAKIVGLGPTALSSGEWSSHYGLFLPDMLTPFPPDQNPLLLAIRGAANSTEMFLRNPEIENGIWIEANACPLKDKAGTVRGGVVAFRDITQRKTDEQEIRKLNNELELRVAARTGQLEAANKELEAFTYSVSHDLRAPLRHISGFSRLLSEEFGSTLAPEAQRHLQRIQDGTRRMGLLVDDLLNLARVGRREPVLQVSGLKSIVDEILDEMVSDCEGRQIEWKIGDLPFVECDPGLIKQVFQNLLANAVKFTRPRAHAVIEVGQIELVETDQSRSSAVFVRDNGVGFSMKYADKLFGVFQRLHRAEDFEGTGVGLATIHRIIQKHGGKIWAEAALDKGATFFFTLGTSEPSEPKVRVTVAGANL